jgi:hypothetical protein
VTVARPRLAGAPVRVSPAPSTSWGGLHDGVIKVRLCHAKGRSYLLPDALFGFGGTRFFLPSFFGPPKLVFDIPTAGGSFGPSHHEVTIDLDVAAPRATVATRVVVTFRSDGWLRSYTDGAQLYRCTYRSPLTARLAEQVAGNCVALPDNDFSISVYHHTIPDNAALIATSAELWSSPYNLAGKAKLANVSHLYFTTLPTIENEADLRRVAMSSSSAIDYQTTSDRPREEALALTVYEGSVDARGSTLRFAVPSGIVAPPHLLHHPLTMAEPSYYEVVGQEIVRVAVEPGVAGTITGDAITVLPTGLKRFGYVIEGNASDMDGLVAPMLEGGAPSVAHIEPLDAGLDLFEFWKANKNRDLHSGRAVEARILQP